jgi:hypothetical protein
MASPLTVVLPGRGYNALGPCIRFPVLALEENGAVTRVVTYGSTIEETRLSLADAIAGDWSSITFVAKSLGTRMLASLGPLLRPSIPVRAIWLTPLLFDEEVRAGAVATGWPALIVAGLADEAHDPEGHTRVVAALGASELLFDRGDHGLEVPGDVWPRCIRWMTSSPRYERSPRPDAKMGPGKLSVELRNATGLLYVSVVRWRPVPMLGRACRCRLELVWVLLGSSRGRLAQESSPTPLSLGPNRRIRRPLRYLSSGRRQR